MDIHSGVHDDAFRRWKSARITLTCAIRDYLTTSTALCNVLSSSVHHFSRFSLEQALSGIDLELSSLQLEEERLKGTRTTLANERNKSRVLSPVHKLPPEILAMVFLIATSQYTRRDSTTPTRKYSSPTALASVSSSWRRIALGTPPLWSYIGLIVGSRPRLLHRKQAELWVERSCNAVLYVNITDDNYDFDQDPMPSYQLISFLEFLAPLMHRVHALEMSASLGEHDVLLSVLALWAEHTSTDIKKTLQIVNNYFGENSSAVLGPASDGSFSAGEFNSFFRSFNRLVVQNCRVSESVMFHEGLVELHLEDIRNINSLTQQELAAILVTTPRLRILVLANCWVEPSGEIPSPVALNHLQFLSLESERESHGFVHVLPLLAIGSEGLSMSLTLDGQCNFIDEARAFFGRTKVTRLHAWSIHARIPLSMLPYQFPHLETLALDSFDISGEFPQAFFDLNGDGQNTGPWPRLHTLYLKDPAIGLSCLQQLVQLQRPPKKLHIYRPQSGTISLTDEECAHLTRSMHMVEDFEIEFDWGSRTIGTWDFVILNPY